ncbi:ISAfe7, transposase OrfA [Novosphingobium pentaromativorans US6-1]|uniref:ISAfe7, transposase OrfA n=1 Tax=Novosphingobium pentaromativorans US6-1 TaxID=1088721 RepID=G6EFK0_9SPHN|nr:ISAfe7, transposase OrfA [Novosphingobium pentaromativorans US6-1]
MRERVVRMVFDNDSQHGPTSQAIMSISAKIGGADRDMNRR